VWYRPGLLVRRALAPALAVAAGACFNFADGAAGPGAAATLPSPASTPTTTGPARLTVDGSPSVIISGAMVTYRARLESANGGVAVPAGLTWQSSDPAVASIFMAQQGWALVQANRPGSVTITAQNGTDVVSFPITVRSAPEVVSDDERSPIVVSSFRVMHRVERGEAWFTPLATIAPRSDHAVVIAMTLELPGVPRAPGCAMERRFTRELPLFGKTYGDWELEIGGNASFFPTAAPILHLTVLDPQGVVHRVDTVGEVIPFDPDLAWPTAFPVGGFSCG
jgi:hypothetical protein